MAAPAILLLILLLLLILFLIFIFILLFIFSSYFADGCRFAHGDVKNQTCEGGFP
jgi:hypothetical protein